MGPLSAAPIATGRAGPTLLAVPNISEGRDRAAIDAIAAAFASVAGVELLDLHCDVDHHRSVVTLAGQPGTLAPALAAGAAAAIERIDLTANHGVHPHVGAVDVAPIVYLDPADRGAACAEALLAGELIGSVGLPVLLYGGLAQGRTRAELRRGGATAVAARIAAGELEPEFGPAAVRPQHGVTLVAARPPLVAFNVTLAPPATVEQAREIAAAIREGGAAGLPGLRAIGVPLAAAGAVQISMNVERPDLTPLRTVLAAIAAHAPIAAAELVALAPEAAFERFPAEVPIPGFDPDRHLIERLLRRRRSGRPPAG